MENARSARGRRTRARLIEAGKTVFERDGFLEARITDISAEAGLSHGAIYHYFDSKEEIFREIAEAVEVRLVSMNDVAGPSEDATPFDRIRAANRSYLAAYRKEAKIMRVIEEVSRYDAGIRNARAKRDDYFAVRLEAAIARLQAEGVADLRLDKSYAATALGCMVTKFAEVMFISGAPYSFDAAVDQLTFLWANALGMDGPVRSPSSKTTVATVKKGTQRRPRGH